MRVRQLLVCQTWACCYRARVYDLSRAVIYGCNLTQHWHLPATPERLFAIYNLQFTSLVKHLIAKCSQSCHAKCHEAASNWFQVMLQIINFTSTHTTTQNTKDRPKLVSFTRVLAWLYLKGYTLPLLCEFVNAEPSRRGIQKSISNHLGLRRCEKFSCFRSTYCSP